MKSTSLRRRAIVLTTALDLAVTGLTTASADDDAGGPVRLHGYVTMDDGARIKYSVILPSATGRCPVLFEYDGYGAGSSSSVSGETKRLLDAGYAVMGANVRGTGCSSETWDLFHPQWGRDGAALVDWAGSQPWSTGKVGMYGVSFSGYLQLWVAANRPKHLAQGRGERFGDPAMPRVELWHETTTGNQPSAVTTYPRWPVQRDAVALHLGADGALSRSAPAMDGGESSYRYPSSGSPVDYPQFRGWTAPPPPGGSLAFTTEPLADDLTLLRRRFGRPLDVDDRA